MTCSSRVLMPVKKSRVINILRITIAATIRVTIVMALSIPDRPILPRGAFDVHLTGCSHLIAKGLPEVGHLTI